MIPPPPSDEFDAVVLQHDGRRGAHRAKPRRVSAVLSAGLVAAATVAVAGGAYVLLDAPAARSSTPAGSTSAVAAGAVVDAPAPGAAPTSDAASGAASGAASDTASDAAGSAGADSTPGAAAPTPTPAVTSSRSASASSSASESSSASSTATSRAAATARTTATARSTRTGTAGSTDTAVPLVVLNGTRTKGLASTASTRLHAGGWRVQSTGNDRSGAAATTVSYADPALAATAAAVAADVGGSAVHDARATEGVLTVVLGPDYSG